MDLSIVIPVFNEKNLLPKILCKVLKYTPKIKKEFIIIDDCSNDGTREWLQKIKSKNCNFVSLKKGRLFFFKNKRGAANLKILLKNKNEGKGSAVILGLKKCKKDIIVIQDADLEYHPRDLNNMFVEINKKNCDIVYGNRFSLKKNRYHYFLYALGNFFLSNFVSFIFYKKLFDIAVCYKMFRKEVVKNLKLDSKDFMFDFEFTSKILKIKKWKISQINIFYKGRTFKEGKKISWVDGFRALILVLKVKLFY